MTTRRPGSGLEAPESGAASEEERDSVTTISQEVEDLWPSVCPGLLPRTCLLRCPPVTSCKEDTHLEAFLTQIDPPVTSCVRQPSLRRQSQSRLCFHTRGLSGHEAGLDLPGEQGGRHGGYPPRHVAGLGQAVRPSFLHFYFSFLRVAS